MYRSRNKLQRLAALALALVCFTVIAAAADVRMDSASVYCFRADEFSENAERLSGVYVVSVPLAEQGEVRIGSRALRAGDVVSRSSLDMLQLHPTCETESQCVLCYKPIEDGTLGQTQSMRFVIHGGKNQAPVSEDSTLETYKNVANIGKLCVSDAEGESLSYQLVKQPKRGSVELHPDGSFTYTPDENKVGKDSFRFTATDSSGNVSNEASVKIRIVKPTDKAMYEDMADRDGEYIAMWLKERGAYTGKTVAGRLCFSPEENVGRAEFLVMAMHLFGAEPDDAVLTSGFADEAQTPAWMRPYLVRALRSGMISGTGREDGLYFRPADCLTRAEAAVMVQNILDLPSEGVSVFSLTQDGQPLVPIWAQQAVSALAAAGIETDVLNCEQPLTRMEASQLLYEACMLAEAKNASSST